MPRREQGQTKGTSRLGGAAVVGEGRLVAWTTTKTHDAVRLVMSPRSGYYAATCSCSNSTNGDAHKTPGDADRRCRRRPGGDCAAWSAAQGPQPYFSAWAALPSCRDRLGKCTRCLPQADP